MHWWSRKRLISPWYSWQSTSPEVRHWFASYMVKATPRTHANLVVSLSVVAWMTLPRLLARKRLWSWLCLSQTELLLLKLWSHLACDWSTHKELVFKIKIRSRTDCCCAEDMQGIQSVRCYLDSNEMMSQSNHDGAVSNKIRSMSWWLAFVEQCCTISPIHSMMPRLTLSPSNGASVS